MTKPSEAVLSVYKDFVDSYEVITQPSPFFIDEDGQELSPKDYWDRGRKRFNSLIDPRRTALKRWQSRYKTGLARNKILGILAHVVSQNMESSITAQNKDQIEDKIVSLFLKDNVEFSLDREKFFIKQFWATLTALAEGTVCFEENYGIFKQNFKDITEFDAEKQTVKWEDKEVIRWKGAFFEQVPNEYFLRPNPYIRNLDDQDYVIRWYRITRSQFMRYFGGFEKSKDVIPGTNTSWATGKDTTLKNFNQYVQLQKNEVFVAKRFRLSDDTLHIVANGIMLTKEDNPIPRPIQDGKHYPFVEAMAEPIDNDFCWGRSLSDRLGDEEDAVNLLYRYFFDTSFRNAIPTVETDNEALLNEDLNEPGTVIAKQQGSEGTRAIMPPTPTADLANLITYLEKNADDNSISQLQMGKTPTGGTPTASQVLLMAKNAEILLNTFNELQRHFIASLTEMRCETIIWRLSDMVDELGHITIHDRMLKSGKKGSRTYFLEPGFSKMNEESREGYSSKLKDIEDNFKNKMEAVIIDPDELLENMDWFVKSDAEPKPRRTDELMKMLSMDKFNFYKANMDVFNPIAAAEEMALVYGDDPAEVVREQPVQGQPGQPEQPVPGSQNPMPDPQVSMKQALGLQQ
jgi:hypothetical protein